MSQWRNGLVSLAMAAILAMLLFSHLHPLDNQYLAVLLHLKEPPTKEPTWLIWTSSAAHLRQRREIIRSTWQALYRSVPFEALFVIGTPSEEWLPVIKQENDTYGDMIMLESPGDDGEFARTLKPFEMFKYLKSHAANSGKSWNFISKIDDDSFLDAGTFRNEFLLPLQSSERTIISRVVQYGRPHAFPGGQFYTLTWDLVELVADLYENTSWNLTQAMYDVPGKRLAKRHEDFMVADLLIEAGERFEYAELGDERAFDILVQGNVTEKAINPHKMKTDEQYLWVAAMYDEYGFRASGRNGIILEEKLGQTSSTPEC